MDPAAAAAVRVFRALTGGWLLVLAVIPWPLVDRLPVRCLLRPLAGRPCPGCGLSHSVWLVLHGQFRAALEWNPLGYVALPLGLAFVVWGWPKLRFQPGQLRAALLWVWAIITVTLAAVLVAAAAAPPAVIFQAAPVCQSRPCALCGMTHAFLSISRGELRQATRENPASVPLYAGMAGNEALFALALFRFRRTQC